MLHLHVVRLNRRLSAIEDNFVSDYTMLLNQRSAQTWYTLEGMLSQSWQAWCAFCRDVFIESCLGGQTLAGLTTTPDVDWTSSERVSYIATSYARSGTPKLGKTIVSLRHEFTWGDVNLLMRAVAAMKPTNEASLLSGFGLSVTGAKHLQIVRNACAHLNTENRLSVKNLSIYYTGRKLRHPSDLMLWNDAVSTHPAFVAWLDDIKTIASIAIK